MIGAEFISSDSTKAIDMCGNKFTVYSVGEIVAHQDKSVGIATILSFEIDHEDNSILVKTDKGNAHLGFLEKHCPECSDHGFLLSTNEYGNPEIQRCDACERFRDDDEATKVVYGKAVKVI